MEHIHGPDFPPGHHHGPQRHPGGLRHRPGPDHRPARHEFEEFGKDRTRIIITEIPYQVNKRMLIKNMADQVEDKRLEGISDIRDETDRNGMRIVIELKRDANPQVVLNRLFAQTQLQTTFAINMLALVEVNGKLQPKILSLRHILDEYIAYQEQIIIRRTRFDLKRPRSGPTCWRACWWPRTTSTRSSISSAPAMTTPGSDCASASTWMRSRPRPFWICA